VQGDWTVVTVLGIGAEIGCLKFATRDEGGSEIQWWANIAGTKVGTEIF
jgi:uncharacterized protein YqgC (DUF456 family)